MKVSVIAEKYPTYRDEPLKTCNRWLDGKRIDDNAEGLWRVHDKLYDLTDFIHRHPGGSEWLELTKGVDITEQFETHHITEKAEQMIKKFYVRDAALPRNYKITFNENGFYKTLKRNVAGKVLSLDRTVAWKSRFYLDMMLLIMLILAVSTTYNDSNVLVLVTSISLMVLMNISHNFLHQRNNWRMYTMNLGLMSFRDWRVFHAMSHHLYPNSLHDLEISFAEPFLKWLPEKKSVVIKYGSLIVSPIFYSLMLVGNYFKRLLSAGVHKQNLYWDDVMPFVLPTVMFIFGGSDLTMVLRLWLKIIFMTSLIFGFIALNAGHHHEKIFHDGDELKSLDFGVYQLATVIMKSEGKDSLFVNLATYGDHALHHFFPTLDHAVLPQLRDVLLETCLVFEVELRELPFWKLIIGQFHQLTRTKPTQI